MAQLAGFIQIITICCYTQNVKAPALVVLEIFFVLPIVSLCEISVVMESNNRGTRNRCD